MGTMGWSAVFNCHIIASNLTKHINKHKVLYDLHQGFREKKVLRNPLMNLLEVSHKVNKLTLFSYFAGSLSQSQQTDLILLFFSKAFDNVSHTKFLFKLDKHGTTQIYLRWIKAFLLRRSNDYSDTDDEVLDGGH